MELSKGNLMVIEAILKGLRIDPSKLMLKATELESVAKTVVENISGKITSIDQNLIELGARQERIEYMLAIALARMEAHGASTSPAGESDMLLLDTSTN
jgi:hypothetical protein